MGSLILKLDTEVPASNPTPIPLPLEGTAIVHSMGKNGVIKVTYHQLLSTLSLLRMCGRKRRNSILSTIPMELVYMKLKPTSST
jgi:hypothetical protein